MHDVDTHHDGEVENEGSLTMTGAVVATCAEVARVALMEGPPSISPGFGGKGIDSATIARHNEARRARRSCDARKKAARGPSSGSSQSGAIRRCGVDAGLPRGPRFTIRREPAPGASCVGARNNVTSKFYSPFPSAHEPAS